MVRLAAFSAAVAISPPLGVSGASYRASQFTLPPGRRLVLFSDGLVERRGEFIGEGLNRLLMFLSQSTNTTAYSVWNALEFPALTRNPTVKEIWRVDPRPPQVRGVDPEKCEPPRPQLLWSHTRGDARPKQLLKCDWR